MSAWFSAPEFTPEKERTEYETLSEAERKAIQDDL
jgi:hypothetical protein